MSTAIECGFYPCEKPATHKAVNRERGTVSYRCNEHITAYGHGRYSVEPLTYARHSLREAWNEPEVGDSLGEEIDDAEMAEQLGDSPSSQEAK